MRKKTTELTIPRSKKAYLLSQCTKFNDKIILFCHKIKSFTDHIYECIQICVISKKVSSRLCKYGTKIRQLIPNSNVFLIQSLDHYSIIIYSVLL